LGARRFAPPDAARPDRWKVSKGKTGILYDAFHFIALLMHRSSVALRECALTENASAHDGMPFAFIDRIAEKTNDGTECLRSACKSGLS